MLYALGIGASELDFVYERGLKAVPSFAVIPAFPAMMGLSAAVEINLVMVLHGEQSFKIHKTIPTQGKLTTTEFLCRHVFDAMAKAAREGALGAEGKGLAKIRVVLHETDLARAWFEGAV